MKARRWIRAEFQLNEPYQDLIVGQLASLGFDGFFQEGTTLHAFIPFEAWTMEFKAGLQLALDAFHSSFPECPATYAVTTVSQENWNKRWEQSAGIVEATERILIKPSWKTLRKKDRGKIVLHIDPKMAFGTGHHETTRLSLRLLEGYVRKGMTVLDFGCGTGVLAIAAIKLGAVRSDGVDFDEWAIVNAKENVHRNRCDAKIRIRRGGIEAVPRKRYDLIVSNTDVPTLSANLPKLLGALKPGGPLLVSGLMTTDLESFFATASALSLEPSDILSENEWAALCFYAPDAPRRD
jgi:ribosomal protein L11 methyltransferase